MLKLADGYRPVTPWVRVSPEEERQTLDTAFCRADAADLEVWSCDAIDEDRGRRIAVIAFKRRGTC